MSKTYRTSTMFAQLWAESYVRELKEADLIESGESHVDELGNITVKLVYKAAIPCVVIEGTLST